MKGALRQLAAIIGITAAIQPDSKPFTEPRLKAAPAPKKDDSDTARYGRRRNQRQKRKLYRQVPQLRRSKHATLKNR